MGLRHVPSTLGGITSNCWDGRQVLKYNKKSFNFEEQFNSDYEQPKNDHTHK